MLMEFEIALCLAFGFAGRFLCDVLQEITKPGRGAFMASNTEAVKKYQAGRDAIMLRPSKEDGQRIRKAAADAGQSVQAFILQAVNDRINGVLPS